MKIKNWEISSGALLAAALFFYLDRNGIAGGFFLACALHELGHYVAIKMQGGKVRALRITCAGAELCLSSSWQPTAEKMLITALAGPGTNLLLAGASIILARRGMAELFFFAALNMGLAVFNLLPARWLDGGKALESLLLLWGAAGGGELVLRICSWCVTGLFLTAGGILLWQSGGHNFALLIAGAWMLGAELLWEGKKGQTKRKNKNFTCF